MKTMRNQWLFCLATAVLSACSNEGGAVTDVDMGGLPDAGQHDGATSMDMDAPVDAQVDADGSAPADARVDAALVPLAMDDLGTAYVDAYCHLIFTCSTDAVGEAALVLALAGDESTCRSRLGRLLLTDRVLGLPQQLRGVTEGTLTYDALAARACIESLDCNVFASGSPTIATCTNIFNGTVESGGDCNADFVCAGDNASCVSASHTCPGTCGAALVLGSECVRDSQCAADADGASVRCRYNGGSSSVCTRVLFDTVGSGANCDATTGDNTITFHRCADGYYCDQSGDAPVCAAVSASGGACTSLAACPHGEFCNDGTCGPFTGIATTVGADCSTSICSPFYDLGCDAETSTCVTIGDGSVGTRCTSSEFSFPCDPGLYCDDNTSLCATQKMLGDACSASEECVSGLCATSATTLGVADAGMPTMSCQANCTL